MTALDTGRRTGTIRARGASLRVDVRSAVVVAAAAVAVLALLLVALSVGDYPIGVLDVARTLVGAGDPGSELIVLQWRLPRALLAIVIGAALAVSGAIFQSITRNPLGSPDIIGFASGSYTGALVAILVVGGGGALTTAGGALIGGIATAAAVYLLAYRRGVQGFRLIVVGIGVSAMLASLNTFLILRADLGDAMAAAVWGAGSLNGLSFAQLWPVLAVTAVLLPLAVCAEPAMRRLELGDDAARALGVRAERTRLGLVVLGVSLTALGTAAAGPISFIALAAPQIARRLARSSGVSILPAAAVGAVLLLLADIAAQRLFAPTQLPVGILTVSIGGIYFIWLLTREARRN